MPETEGDFTSSLGCELPGNESPDNDRRGYRDLWLWILPAKGNCRRAAPICERAEGELEEEKLTELLASEIGKVIDCWTHS